MTAPAQPCTTCARRPDVLPLSSPGYECAHVECPRRRPLTAAPCEPGPDYDAKARHHLEERDPWE